MIYLYFADQAILADFAGAGAVLEALPAIHQALEASYLDAEGRGDQSSADYLFRLKEQVSGILSKPKTTEENHRIHHALQRVEAVLSEYVETDRIPDMCAFAEALHDIRSISVSVLGKEAV